MPLFFVIVFVIYTVACACPFIKWKRLLGDCAGAKIIFYICFFLVYAAFPVAMLGRDTLPLALLRPMYFVGTSWLGLLIYLLLCYLLTDLLSLAVRRRFPRIQTAFAITVSVAVCVYGYIRFDRPRVIEKEISINKTAGRHQNLTVVCASDLHLGMGIYGDRLRRYVNLINSQQPDLVLFGGDIVDNTLRPLFDDRMYDELARIHAPLGVYACPGNHEYMGEQERMPEFYRKSRINLLIDDATLIDSALWIIGRDDSKTHPERAPLPALLARTDPALPVLLIDHEPYHLEEASDAGIDLQFSGHTHDGQMWPGTLLVKRMYELPHGYMQRGRTHYFVSSGLGIWGPLFRIGSESDLIVIKIKFS